MARTDLLGRANIVLRHMLEANIGAATRATIAPERLSPEESKTLVQKWGLADSPFAPLFELATDPLFLIGLVLSFRFPVARLSQMFKIGEKVAKMRQRTLLPPQLQHLKSPYAVFDDLPEVTDALDGAGRNRISFLENTLRRIEQTYQRFTETAGRPITQRDRDIGFVLMDRLDSPHPKVMEHFRAPDGGKLRSPFDRAKLKAAVTPAHKDFADDMRAIMDDTYDEIVIRHPDMREELAIAMRKHFTRTPSQQALEHAPIPQGVRETLRRGTSYKTVRKKLEDENFLRPGEYVEGYAPHRLPHDMEEFERRLQELIQAARGGQRKMAKMTAPAIARQVSPHLTPRLGRMLPNPDDLRRKFPDLLDEKAVADLETVMADKLSESGALKGIAPYTVSFDDAIEGYVNSMASTFAFNMNGAGRRLIEARDKLLASGAPNNVYRAAILENTLIPAVAGKQDFQRSMRSLYLAGVQDRIRQFLETDFIKKTLGGEGKGSLWTWMMERIGSDRGRLSAASIESNLVQLMYDAAIGGNIGMAALNAMQTLSTTIPLFGTAAIAGLGRVLRKLPRYFELRSSGSKHMEALTEIFPDFVAAGLGGPTAHKFGELDRIFQVSGAVRLETGWTRVRKALMLAFNSVETMNQLVAFETGMYMAGLEALPLAEARMLARRAVQETQFVPGVANTPILIQQLRGLPGGRLLSMFGQFALRFPEFLLHRGTLAGSAEMATAIGGRNLGTLGRAAMVSAAVYELGKGYGGLDLSRGLIFGALPEPREGAPFFPAPFVPPALGIAGGLVSDLFHGNLRQTRRALPLFIPGGIGITRLVSSVSPGAARLFGRRYADYSSPEPDGTYRVYQFENGEPMMVSRMRPAQIVGMALGLPGAGSDEAASVNWLLANKERIRDYKRAYLRAIEDNDYRKASAVDREFRRAYPIRDGIRALTRPRDVQMIELRRNATRIERIIRTLPAEMKPMMTQALLETIMADADSVLGAESPSRASTKRGRTAQVNRRAIGTSWRRTAFSAGMRGPQQRAEAALPEVGAGPNF